MKIYIDTTRQGEIVLGIGGNKVVEKNPDQRSQKVLVLLEKKLKEKGLTIADVSEVEVETGPGSFTGVRVGVSVANAIGYARHILVNETDIEKDGPIIPKY